MSRLTEYPVSAGRRTSSRLAASPTTTPSSVNDTTDGRSTRPSPSGITRESPVFSSTYATRLFVVPRSMPTIRDIAFLALPEGVVQVVDHRAEVRADRQRLLHGSEHALPLRRLGGVPPLTERPDEPDLIVPQPRHQAVALDDERGAAGLVEAARLGLRERLLDLEHLHQQLGRGLGLDRGALLRVAALLETHEVLDARDRVPEGSVGSVQPRRRLERPHLLLGRRRLVEVRVVPPRQLVELPLQLRCIDGEPPRKSEDLEVVHSLTPSRSRRQNKNGPSAGPVLGGSTDPATPRTTCRIHSSTSRWDSGT